MTKVEYKRLRTAWGYAYIKENKIELYKDLKGKKHLEILVHEKLHLLFPDMDENAVIRISKDITQLLWSQNYRRI